MHTLKSSKNGFEKYELSDEISNSSVTFVPERGGIITSLILNGKEIMYFDRDLFEKDTTIRAGGFPILFPICGRLNEGGYSINKKVHMMPTHGFARQLPWKVNKIDLEKGKVILNLTGNKETMKYYPFDFELEFSYTLTKNEFLIEQKYINNSDTDMPFYAGFHPFFSVGDKSGLEFSINAENYYFYENGEEKKGKYRGKIDFNSPVDFVFILDEHYGNEYSMYERTKDQILKISTSENFKFMVMWTVEGKDFVCLEPWMASPDSMNTKRDLKTIKPGRTIESWIKLAIY